ncbi:MULTISPECIES: aldehyde dehydrogenase family protein [unclassified Nitratiruptor]|uniref:aldehyde dehydrogenase family protein n=1 Tax=unclassified Nitratiruptor TaxID=2624044 RepID=UPI001916B3D2|nr:MULTISPECIES: aldehyde dehydrogenase family protein [unclassified Nitratiruptor]BCD60844.1 aldehyde dehydrogenase [Nitratiruptor sp. YY08-10]BCD64776.1 aldehyde dehydrogenase [Nitratiruptor sp. YY08-14]
MEEAKIYFGSTPAHKEEWEEHRSPFNDKVVAKFPKCDAEDAKKALQIAQKAFQKYKNIIPLSQRVAWLRDVAAKLKEQKEEFALTITKEVGKPIAFSRVEVQRAIETIELSADFAVSLNGETINTDATQSGRKTMSYYKRVPLGVVVAITPFNFPLNLSVHKLAPALVTGNSVVYKPTPEAPLTGYKLAKLFIESEYAVPDMLSLVYGDAEVGNALVTNEIPRKISFTGSVPVGKIIMKNAGIKKVSLELGGNAATFIDKDADIKMAASRCAVGAFVNSGQVCISLQRIYVHEAVYEEFAQALANDTKKLKVGDPYEPDTFMGPLINEEAAMRAERWVQSAIKAGARAILEGKREGKYFYPAILADVTDDMEIVCEEVFAPIVSLVKVQSYEEAIEKMNDSPYGLQFSIFTKDIEVIKRFVDDAEAGGVVVNDIPTLRFDIQPYGGVKYSGIGREGPKFALEEYTELKSVVIV